jgi:hypothetical protein
MPPRLGLRIRHYMWKSDSVEKAGRPAGDTDSVIRCGMLVSAMESGFQCASCGEWNVTSVDESAGSRQSYVEDCQVCCKANVLRIEYDNSSQEFFIIAELE